MSPAPRAPLAARPRRRRRSVVVPAASAAVLAALLAGGLAITAPDTGIAASGLGAGGALTASTSAQLPVSDFPDTRELQLVNRDHASTWMPSPDDLLSLIGRVPTPSTATSISLLPAAADATAAMLDAAQDATGGTLMVTSGFRGHTRQAELYAAAADQRYVLPAGHSEHHTGLALDVQAPGTALADLERTPQGRWVVENSWRFGLILRYPDGSEPVTGVAFEPWHFRYVGKVHAAYMTQHRLLLEEYLEHLQQAGEISIELDGARYLISYQTAPDGMLTIPAGTGLGAVRVSSSNLGGYVVTTARRMT